MSPPVQCPKCGAVIRPRDIDAANGTFFCNACQERWELAPDRILNVTPVRAMAAAAPAGSLTIATPVKPLSPQTPYQPMVPAPPPPRMAGIPPAPSSEEPVVLGPPSSQARGVPTARTTGMGARSSPPSAGSAPNPFGSAWQEQWDGRGFHVVLRRVSLPSIALVAFFLLGVCGWAYTQQDIFGDMAMVGVGVGGVLGLVILSRMYRYTYIHFDPKELLVQQKPTGKSSAVSTFHIEKLILLDEGAPGRMRAGFYVAVVPLEGLSQPIDLELHTEAEARFVAERLTEMLHAVAGVRRSFKPPPPA
jgi:hypothetical protein